MGKTDVQVNFRMPAELKSRLEQAAKENHRSVTAELVARLESTFTQDQSTKLTVGISKQALAEQGPGELSMHDKDEGVHVFTDGQLRAILNSALDSFIERLGGQATQPKGPRPRKKYPRQ